MDLVVQENKFIVFDIETDGFIDNVTKIHCLSYFKSDEKIIKSITEKEDIINFFKDNSEFYTFIGHNIFMYDTIVLSKLYNINFNTIKCLDTLILSWYLHGKDNRFRHSLEEWGKRLNVQKIDIKDWTNLSIEDYVERCEIDVKINLKLYLFLNTELNTLYEKDTKNILNYLTFILKCARDQYYTKLKIDRKTVKNNLNKIDSEILPIKNNIENLMPKRFLKKEKIKPKNLYKKDGSLSSKGIEWFNFLKDNNLEENEEGPITYISGEEEPNVNSSEQLKEWLFSLGWKPKTFKKSEVTENKVKTGTYREVPQIKKGKDLCPSILELSEKVPEVKMLVNLGTLNHRKGVLKNFLKNSDENGITFATLKGVTNTLRWKHTSPITNLPKPSEYYGKEIRECIVKNDDNSILVGSDLSGLESSTADHYIFKYDPDYVKDKREPGFDPHLDIAFSSGMINKEEVDFFKWYKNKDNENEIENSSKEKKEEYLDKYKKINKIRSLAKTVNFACTYGAGVQKIAQTAEIPIEDAKILWNTYWKRNWAIKEVSKNTTIRILNDKFGYKDYTGEQLLNMDKEDINYIFYKYRLFVYNTVSKMYIELRSPKDIFSSLNQSTGAYVFNNYLREIKIRKLEPSLQYHDEFMVNIKKDEKEKSTLILKESIKALNKKLKLNIEIGIDYSFGENYAEVH